MNSESVTGWLEAMGVPTEVVAVGTESDDAWCLLRADVEDEPGWEVFWREQGNRYDWARFTSEQVACFYLFGRLTWTQALRGVVGPLDTGAHPQQGAAQQGAAQQIPSGQAHPGQGAPTSAPQPPGSAAPTPPRGTPAPVPPAPGQMPHGEGR